MAKSNTTLAIDHTTRDRLNELINEYNNNKSDYDKELTAKDFISIAVNYFMDNKILKNLVPDIEVWKDISESDDMYQISNKGRIKRKSHIQRFNAVRYVNRENGRKCEKRIIERVYNERIINPFFLNGVSCIKFANGKTSQLFDLMRKYYGKNNRGGIEYYTKTM